MISYLTLGAGPLATIARLCVDVAGDRDPLGMLLELVYEPAYFVDYTAKTMVETLEDLQRKEAEKAGETEFEINQDRLRIILSSTDVVVMGTFLYDYYQTLQADYVIGVGRAPQDLVADTIRLIRLYKRTVEWPEIGGDTHPFHDTLVEIMQRVEGSFDVAKHLMAPSTKRDPSFSSVMQDALSGSRAKAAAELFGIYRYADALLVQQDSVLFTFFMEVFKPPVTLKPDYQK